MRNSSSCNCTCYFLSLVALGFVCVTVMFCSVLELKFTQEMPQIPLAINTWPFVHATRLAWDVLANRNLSAVDAVELGCTVCEEEQCDFTVGFGGSPDENGETTLDAFIMDGTTMNVGAVAALRGVKSAVSVARRVLENTKHSMLAGELASQFAIEMGFKFETLTTNKSKEMWRTWVSANCQPNYWMDVHPDPTQQCGPYKPRSSRSSMPKHSQHQDSHDTISMIALDRRGQIAVGTSSNGANHKIPGRVGDAPIVGAGGYADGTVGAAACTGDGDVMMRFLPSFLAVEEMRKGVSPEDAAQTAISRIKQYYPSFSGAIIVVNLRGEYAAACHGLSNFPYSVHSPTYPSGILLRVPCI